MELHWKYGFPLPDKYKDNHTITLNALHFQPDNSSARGHILLLTGETFEDYFTATKLIQHPNIDSAFIIQNGTYGYNSVGSIPVRDIPEMGSFIKDGRSDLYDIKRVLTDEEEPFFVNPSKGYFGMANNKFASDHF